MTYSHSRTQICTIMQYMETYSIFWLDASIDNQDNFAVQKQLRSIINQLKIFNDAREFMSCIRQLCQRDLTILIVSGNLGRKVVPELQNIRQVSSIYIYCYDKPSNEQWSRAYNKVAAPNYFNNYFLHYQFLEG